MTLPNQFPDQAKLTMTGLEQLSAVVEGHLPRPSMADTLNFRLVEVSEGTAAFEGEPPANALNPMGMIHGGWAATILDSALGCAVHTSLAAGEAYSTMELKVNMVRAIMPDTGTFRCEGTILYRGRRTATADAKLFNAEGKLVAHGTTTCIIFAAD